MHDSIRDNSAAQSAAAKKTLHKSCCQSAAQTNRPTLAISERWQHIHPQALDAIVSRQVYMQRWQIV
jgi:hypothetical protein